MKHITVLFTILLVVLWFAFFPNSIDTFGLPKALLGTLLIVPLFIYTLFRAKHSIPKDRLFVWVMVLFVVTTLVALVFAQDIGGALLGSPFRYQGAAIQLLFVMVMFASWYAHQRRHLDVKALARNHVYIGCAAAVIALVGYFYFPSFFSSSFFSGRVFGFLGNPNDLALMLLFVIPLTLLQKPNIRWTSILLLSVVMLATGSRTGMALLLVWALVEAMKLHHVIRKRTIIGVLVIFVGLFSVFAWQIEGIRGSAGMRLDMYKAGMVMSLDSPWVGYGQDVYWQTLAGYLPEHLVSTEIIDRVHSAPIDRALAGGILHAIIFELLVLVVLLRYAFSHKKTDEQNAFALGLILAHLFVFANIESISSLLVSGVYLGLLIPKK